MSNGRFGIHGGQYIPETLMNAIHELEEAYNYYKNDNEFDVIIPSGINNYSDPETQDLPTTFTAGNIETAFRVRMEGTTASWTLNGVTAEANTSTATCNGNNAPTCQTTSYETD